MTGTHSAVPSPRVSSLLPLDAMDRGEALLTYLQDRYPELRITNPHTHPLSFLTSTPPDSHMGAYLLALGFEARAHRPTDNRWTYTHHNPPAPPSDE